MLRSVVDSAGSGGRGGRSCCPPASRAASFACGVIPAIASARSIFGNLIQVRGALAVAVVAGLPLIASGKLGRDIHGKAVSLRNTFTRRMVQRLITGEKLYG
jgi:hypothetical protein